MKNDNRFRLIEEERAIIRESRTILLIDEMNNCTSASFIQDMFVMLAGSSRKPISVIISSEGGSLWSCLAIIKAIRYAQANGIKVHGHVFGNAFSAAFLVLQACDHRVAGSESIMMIHGISHFPTGDSKNVKRDQQMIDDVTKQLCKMLYERNTSKNEKYKNEKTCLPSLKSQPQITC